MNHPPPIPSKKNQTNKNTPTSCNGKQSNNGIVLSFLFFFLASVEISLTTYRPNFLLKKITISGLHAPVIVGQIFRHSSTLAIIAMTS